MQKKFPRSCSNDCTCNDIQIEIHPPEKTFRSIEQCLRETNKFLDGKHSNRSRVVSDNDNSVIVLAYFHANPRTSVRAVSAETNISVGSIHKILKENKYHPFKLTFVYLRPTDEIRRLEFLA